MLTSNDIAKHLGISRATVSRALNNCGRISDDTRKRVIEAVAELGYEPNRAARALVGAKPEKSAFSFFSQPEYYWNVVKEGISFAHDQLKHFGFDFEMVESHIDKPEEQEEQLWKLYKNGVRVFAIAPNDPVMLDSTICKLSDSGVSVILFNVDVPSKNRLCYLGSDYHREGRLAGDTLARLLRRKGKVGAITFASPVLTISQRMDGFLSIMAQHPEYEIIIKQDYARSGQSAYEQTLAFIRDNPDLSGIFVCFGILEDVAAAVESAGFGGKIQLVGYELSNEVEQYIRRGIIDAVICNDPIMQGYYTTILLYNLSSLGHKPPTDDIRVKTEIVMRENLDPHIDERNRLSILKAITGGSSAHI